MQRHRDTNSSTVLHHKKTPINMTTVPQNQQKMAPTSSLQSNMFVTSNPFKQVDKLDRGSNAARLLQYAQQYKVPVPVEKKQRNDQFVPMHQLISVNSLKNTSPLKPRMTTSMKGIPLSTVQPTRGSHVFHQISMKQNLFVNDKKGSHSQTQIRNPLVSFPDQRNTKIMPRKAVPVQIVKDEL